MQASRGVFGVRRPAREARAGLTCAAALAVALVLSACGSGSRQDVGEPSASFGMRVLRASFPSAQAVARPATLEIEIQNTGKHAMPHRRRDGRLLRLQLELSGPRRHEAADLGDRTRAPARPPRRPWKARKSASRAAPRPRTSTPGRSGDSPRGRRAHYVWKVVAVKARHATRSRYRLAAGLAGKAKAVPARRLAAGLLRRADRAQATDHAREPRHRQGRSRCLLPRVLLGSWPDVERSRARFRHAGDTSRAACDYDCAPGAAPFVGAPPSA